MTESEFEDHLENKFWEFDARRSGYAQWKEAPQSERDAFKQTVRSMRPFMAPDVSAVEVYKIVRQPRSS